MNVIEKPKMQSAQGVADFDRFRLRRFVDALPASELETREKPTDLADVAQALEGNAKVVRFHAVGPEKHELVGNVCGARSRIALAFGVPPDKLSSEIQRRLRNKPDVFEVSRAEAPVQQVVLTGKDADLTTLPVHLQHGADGGPYVSASTDFVIDPKTGWTNVGMRRLMLRSRTETGVDLVAPSDLKAIYEANVAAGKPTPVSFCIGMHPIDHIAAVMRLPVDELGLLSSLREAPLPVVKCITNDIRVPADSEWVLEGYFDERGHIEKEGPYGEFLGYYGAVKHNPVFHLTAITRRHDGLFQTSTISGRAMANTETAQLGGVRSEVLIWRALEVAVREPTAVFVTTASGGSFNVRIAMRQRVPGEARNAITACFGALANCKNVFVVDPDIDIFDDKQMDWALATRFQPDRDLIVVDGMRAMPLDPSLYGSSRVSAKAGFDLTWAFGTGNRLEARIPEAPTYKGKRYPSIEAALADGPKTFEDLMSAVGSRDGREVVLELDAVRQAKGVERDDEGRYFIKAEAAAKK